MHAVHIGALQEEPLNFRPFVIPALVVLTVALSIGAQAQDRPLADAAIRQILVDRIDRDRRSLGMVVGVVTPEGRRVVAYGRQSTNDAQAPDGDTVFEIGSVSKVFTAWLLADMVNRGEVTLADPIDRHLPPTVRVKPNGDGKGITLIDLATHTAGFPFWPPNLRPGELREALATYTTEDLYQFVGSFEYRRRSVRDGPIRTRMPGSSVSFWHDASRPLTRPCSEIG